ncbi:MAG: oxygen-insensitive NADPH nitroreductase [Erysipelothrix sp.]|nr:oxygen-insensitive NADPH nitroreductase [Erysipelothrix sp.]
MELLETILNHTSVRHFEDKKLEQDLKDKLVKAAQSGSSSNFVQAYSIIEVSNPEILEAIQVLSNNSGSIVKSGVFYIFVADLNRNYQISKETNTDSTPFKSMDALLVSIVDATIAAQNMMLYAESINLGGCYIGGIRNDLFSIANLLKLPKYTLPIFGLTLGYPQDKNEVKPRLAQNDIVHLDHYELMDKSSLEAYNKKMEHYYQTREHSALNTNWSTKIQDYFKTDKRPDTLAFIKHQGFNIE